MSWHEILIVFESVLILLLFYQQPCGSPFSWALVPGLSSVVSLSRGCSSTKVGKYRKEKTPGTHCGSSFDSQGPQPLCLLFLPVQNLLIWLGVWCPGLSAVIRERSGVECTHTFILFRMRSLNWSLNVKPTLHFWNKLNM